VLQMLQVGSWGLWREMEINGGSPLTDKQTLFCIQRTNDLSLTTHSKIYQTLKITICDTVFLKYFGVSQLTSVCCAPHLCVCVLSCTSSQWSGQGKHGLDGVQKKVYKFSLTHTRMEQFQSVYRESKVIGKRMEELKCRVNSIL